MKTSCQYKTTAIFFASTQLVHMASPASSCSTNFHVNVHRNDEEQTSSMCKAAQAEKDASPHHITSLANVIGCQDLLHLILLLTADSLQPQDVAINVRFMASTPDGIHSTSTHKREHPITAPGSMQRMGGTDETAACLANDGVGTFGQQKSPIARHPNGPLFSAASLVGCSATQLFSPGVPRDV